MNCPRCGIGLTEVVKNSVTIDVCSSCGGMWLDKGELGKITAQLREAETSVDQELAGMVRSREPIRERFPEGERYDQHDYRYDSEHGYGRHEEYKHRKKSGFQKLFDIFD